MVHLRNLWLVDSALDDVDRTQSALRVETTERMEQVRTTTVRCGQLEHDLAHLSEKEAALERRLKAYLGRRDTTQRLLDQGLAVDFTAASRQLEQCSAIVDELETELLELMEQKDDAERLLVEERDRANDAKVAAEKHAQMRCTKDAELVSRAQTLTGERQARWKEIKPTFLNSYKVLRQRQRTALSVILDGNCSECHISVAPQMALEVLSSRKVLLCRSCHRFLIPPPENECED